MPRSVEPDLKSIQAERAEAEANVAFLRLKLRTEQAWHPRPRPTRLRRAARALAECLATLNYDGPMTDEEIRVRRLAGLDINTVKAAYRTGYERTT